MRRVHKSLTVPFCNKSRYLKGINVKGLDRNKRAGVRSWLVAVHEQLVQTLLASLNAVLPNNTQAPAAPAPPPLNKCQEAEAGVMAVSMQSYDSHANNHSNKPNQNFKSSDSIQNQRKQKPKCTLVCYNCNEEGHRYSQCPKQFDASIMEQNFKKCQEWQNMYDEKKSGKN